MRSLVRGVSCVALAALAACSGEDGALLVVTNPDGAAVARVEVVLASSGTGSNGDIVTVKQRITSGSTLDEDVRYYKQASTSSAIAVTAKQQQDGKLTVLLAPAKDMDATYIPFVLGYDAAGELVAIGRVSTGDADETPAPIAISKSKLELFDVALEKVVAPDPSVGIARDTAMLVSCATDQVVRGAAWKFAKGIQLRLVLAKPGTTSGLGDPFDLDCDGHAVDPAHPSADCDDLEAAFNSAAAEVCGNPDYNCDGDLVGRSPCEPFPGVADCPGHTGCVGDPNGGPSTCIVDAAAAGTDACFCADHTCSSGAGCTIDYAGPDAAQALCAPAVAMVQNPCAVAANPCTIEVKQQPQDWTITLAFSPTAMGSAPVFASTIMIPPMSPGLVLVRAEAANTVTLADPQLPDTFEVEIRFGTSGQNARRATIALDLATQAAGLTCPAVVMPGTVDHVNTMTCTTSL